MPVTCLQGKRELEGGNCEGEGEGSLKLATVKYGTQFSPRATDKCEQYTKNSRSRRNEAGSLHAHTDCQHLLHSQPAVRLQHLPVPSNTTDSSAQAEGTHPEHCRANTTQPGAIMWSHRNHLPSGRGKECVSAYCEGCDESATPHDTP